MNAHPHVVPVLRMRGSIRFPFYMPSSSGQGQFQVFTFIVFIVRRVSQNCEKRLLASSHPSVRIERPAPNRWISIKLDTCAVFENLLRKFKFR
jgi:hypothetical protein